MGFCGRNCISLVKVRAWGLWAFGRSRGVSPKTLWGFSVPGSLRGSLAGVSCRGLFEGVSLTSQPCNSFPWFLGENQGKRPNYQGSSALSEPL